MHQKVADYINSNNLIPPGRKILVALSGGPDSVALLTLLSILRKKLNIELGAAYLNHQIRPAAALKEEKFCTARCKRLNVEFYTAEENVPLLAKKEKMTLGKGYGICRKPVSGKYGNFSKGILGAVNVEDLFFSLE